MKGTEKSGGSGTLHPYPVLMLLINNSQPWGQKT